MFEIDFRILITHLKFFLAMESSVSPEVVEVLLADLRGHGKGPHPPDKVDFIMDTIKAEMGSTRVLVALDCRGAQLHYS